MKKFSLRKVVKTKQFGLIAKVINNQSTLKHFPIKIFKKLGIYLGDLQLRNNGLDPFIIIQ